MNDNEDVTPAVEPGDEPADRHQGPLDVDDDARFLLPDDARRLAVEARLGKKFVDVTDNDNGEG